jgi:hypothetical protein
MVFSFKEFGKVKGKHGYIDAVQRGKYLSMFVILFEYSTALLGLLIALLGIWLAIKTKGLLIGEGANKEIINSIREITNYLKKLRK